MQSQSKFFDDLAKVVNGAAGTFAGMVREGEAGAKERAREWIGGLDFVSRDEFDATRDLLMAARAEIDALKAKVLEGPELDAAVAARGDLIAKARAIAPDVKTEGLSDADIRKAVVTAKLGDAVKDKAEAYIDARFDILAEDAEKVDPVRNVIIQTPVGDGINNAHAGYLARMTGRKEA